MYLCFCCCCCRVVIFQSAREARNKVNGSVPLLTAELSACDVYVTQKSVPLTRQIKALPPQVPNLLLFPSPSSRPLASVIADLRKKARAVRNILLVLCLRRSTLAAKRSWDSIVARIDQFVGVATFECNLCCIDGTWRQARLMANVNADLFGDPKVVSAPY